MSTISAGTTLTTALVQVGDTTGTLNINTGGSNTTAMTITTDGLMQFNSGYGSVATAYGCRAWVNFNGEDTVAIRGSGNISSITDNGTGDYTINFSTAMPDANSSVVATVQCRNSANNTQSIALHNTAAPIDTSSVRVQCRLANANTSYDPTFACISVFR